MTLTTHSAEETAALGRVIGGLAPAGAVLCVALDGPLGAGKTQLARGIAEGAGVDDPGLVSSPTYVVMNIYDGPVPVYHVDAYRLAGPEEAEALGLDEILRGGAGGAISGPAPRRRGRARGGAVRDGGDFARVRRPRRRRVAAGMMGGSSEAL
jgi:tRNA threonylcarbamoyladenosine biosynthesis protein TsaE